MRAYGFEVLNSQSKTFGVALKEHSHDACLRMLANADYVVLIIGGRRGGTYVASERSITNEEIKAAQKLDLPVLAFIDQRVEALRSVYKKNPKGDFKPTVDDVRVFDFIDFVSSGHADNWLHPFTTVTDIVETLRAQFAFYLLCYAQGLRKAPAAAPTKRGQPVGFPSRLDGAPGEGAQEQTLARAGLRKVYDALKAILDSGLKDGAKSEQLKAIWVAARYGEADDALIRVKDNVFKAYAWASTKGQRVFDQMKGFGVSGRYEIDHDDEGRGYQTVEIYFDRKRGEETCPAHALKTWVEDLVAKYGEEEGLDMFKRLDLRMYTDAPEPAKPKARKASAAK